MNGDDILYFNKKHVEKLKQKILLYEKDSDKDKRIKKCECKYCTYINNERMAGASFTESNCKNCNKKLVFPSTDTNKYCEKCAKELNICKHCGSTID